MKHEVTITKGVRNLIAECECGESKVAESAVEILRWMDKHGGIKAMQVQRKTIEQARDEAAVRNQAMFGTDPSWYGR